jgi:hypothetical protein
MRSRVIWFFLQDCHCPRGVIENNSRGTNIKQGSTETNQQQPTALALYWTLKATFCKIRSILNHHSSLQSYFGFFQWLSWYPMGLPSTLKIRKQIIQQASWAGWQHPDDKWSEAVLDPLPFSGLESLQPPICASIHRDSDNYFSQICALGQFDFFYEIAIAREGL